MLNAADVFGALVGINGAAFATAQAGSDALTAARSMLSNGQAIQKKYDRDTNVGLNAAKQAVWDTALRYRKRITFTTGVSCCLGSVSRCASIHGLWA
jgi:hypothetical protein